MDVLLTMAEAEAYRDAHHDARRAASHDADRDTYGRPNVVALGMFDGVHRGHRRLLEAAVSLAKGRGAASVAMTFDRHPEVVLRGGAGPSLLTTNEEKAAFMDEMGLDAVFFCPFDEVLSRMPPKVFAEQIVKGTLGAGTAVVGFNYTFGKGGVGDPGMLTALGARLGFDVVCIGPETEGGEVISASLVRDALLAGNIARANAMLGRAYSLRGPVVKGDGRGAGLGFPTANVAAPNVKAWPADGVYACRCRTARGSWDGVASVSTKPTFAGTDRTVEAFLCGFHGNLYGETLEVFFVERLRGIAVFDGPEALARQIARDVAQACGRLQKV